MTLSGLNFDPARLPAAIPDELAGKVAIVTGAGRGMGRAVAERLSAAGASIVLNDLSTDAAEAAADALRNAGGNAIAVGGDVTSASDVAALVERALSEFGAVHILVNAAGVLRRTAVIDMDEDEWDFVI
ncbi:MAG: SDR family NAD(P)-dependent oxidoreductase, partial [Chloroflexi bacterium]|nr:SDR family NAD(P)-dependent oxidoreductase [Chloroflexota bacterium]